MSFGFSVGDLITVIDRANKVRKEFVGAPAQFKAISDEVRNLSFVVQDVEVDLSSKELSGQQKTELQQIAESCRSVLIEIQNTISNYRELSSDHDMKRQTLGRTWKRFKWEPAEIHDLRNRLSSNIGLLNSFNGRITQSKVTKLVQHQDNQERQAILDWLSPVTYATYQSDYISRRQPGTGKWLLDSPKLQAWIEKPGQTLFCPGIPGASKTIFTSAVIEELHSRFRINSNIGIAYIFCNFQRHGEQRSEHLLASLLKQFAQSKPSLPENVKGLYDQHRFKETRPAADEICRALHLVCGQFSRLFIVIDALDERPTFDGSRTKILDEIFSLQAKYNVNFLATQDVMQYLRANLNRLPSFVSRIPELQDEIITRITDAVDGMFLLAQHHLDSLVGKMSPKAIRPALKDLSRNVRTYDSAYNNAMKCIESQVPDQKELAKQVLSWITCAKRQLTTVELQNALAVEVGESDSDKDNLPDVKDLVSVCGGLVTVDEQSDIIRLVHFTALEYFQRTWTSWFPNAHNEIARTCLTYLSYNPFGSGSCPTDKGYEARPAGYPLFPYAASNRGPHSRALPEDDELVMKLLCNLPKLEACGQGLFAQKRFPGHTGYSQDVPKQVTGLHLAAYFGTPLSWAAANGHQEVVKVLLEVDIDLNSKDDHGRTPLSLEAYYDRDAVIDLLEEKHADLDSKKQEALNPSIIVRVDRP